MLAYGLETKAIFQVLGLLEWLLKLPPPMALQYEDELGNMMKRERTMTIEELKQLQRKEIEDYCHTLGRWEMLVEVVVEVLQDRFGEVPEELVRQN